MAAENAIQNPLLDEVTLKGAKAVLVNITGGLDMTLLEVDEAANAISGPGRSGRQHHLRRRLRSGAGRHAARLGGRHRHGRRLDLPPSSRRRAARRAAPKRRVIEPVADLRARAGDGVEPVLAMPEPEPVFAMVEPEPEPHRRRR